MSLQLTGVHHCSIMVSEMSRAVSFYRDVLGLKEIPTPSTFPAAGLRVRWFDLGNEQIHLMPGGPDKIAPRHFAVHVQDAKAAREYLKSREVEVRETTPIPGADRFFISDPDGNNIEIIQWVQAWPSADPNPILPPE